MVMCASDDAAIIGYELDGNDSAGGAGAVGPPGSGSEDRKEVGGECVRQNDIICMTVAGSDDLQTKSMPKGIAGDQVRDGADNAAARILSSVGTTGRVSRNQVGKVVSL